MAGGFVAPTIITADVTFYAKIDTVVVNDDTWSGLTDDERTALTDAAERARDRLVAERAREGELLADACATGIGVAEAGAAAVQEIAHAARPVSEQMTREATVGPMIKKIEEIKAELPPDRLVPSYCELSALPTDIGPLIDPSVLDGTYRTSFTVEELAAAGDTQGAQNNSGVWTFTLDGGRFTTAEADCPATVTMSETMISFSWDPGVQCSGDWVGTWERTRDGVRFTDVQSAYALDRLIWSLHEWVRID